MEKKITLKEFWESQVLACIHCDTEEKTNTLLKAFDRMGKKWKNGKSYLGSNKWNYYKEDIVYYNDNVCSDLKYAKMHDYTIYEFDEVDLGK